MLKEFPLVMLISLILSFFSPDVSVEPVSTPKETKRPTITATPAMESEEPVATSTEKNNLDNLNVRYFDGVVRSKEVIDIVIDFPYAIKALNVTVGGEYMAGRELAIIDTTLYDSQIMAVQKRINEKQLIYDKFKDADERKNIEAEISRLTTEIETKKKMISNKEYNELKKWTKEYNGFEKDYIATKKELDKLNNKTKKTSNELKQIESLKKKLVNNKAEKDKRVALADAFRKNKNLEIEKLQKLLATNKADLTKKFGLKNDIDLMKKQLEAMKAKKSKPYLKNNAIICPIANGVARNLKIVQNNKIDKKIKLFEIHNKRNIYIEATVSTEILAKVKMGESVLVVDKTTNNEYSGKVANKSKNKFYVRLSKENEIFTPESEVKVRFEKEFV